MLNGCTDISLKDARIRDTLIRELTVPLQVLIHDQTKIAEKFCIKNDTKKQGPLMTYKFKPKEEVKFQKEMEVLMEETLEISILPDTKRVLEDTTYKPKISETLRIDEILGLM